MIRRMASNVARALRLMLVTDDRLVTAERLVEACRAAVRGGVTSVQLRLKRVEPRELVTLARELVAAVPVPVLINDRLDVAMAAGAACGALGSGAVAVAVGSAHVVAMVHFWRPRQRWLLVQTMVG